MPTDEAMRAVRALDDHDLLYVHFDEALGCFSLDQAADLIDRETGLPELQQQFSRLCDVNNAARADLAFKDDLIATLSARLAAVEALHKDQSTEGDCAECVKPWPCPTLRAARGEQ